MVVVNTGKTTSPAIITTTVTDLSTVVTTVSADSQSSTSSVQNQQTDSDLGISSTSPSPASSGFELIIGLVAILALFLRRKKRNE